MSCDWRGFAEYACAHENSMTLKPASMTFEEAAAIPQVAVLTLQDLRDKEQIQPGQKLLIYDTLKGESVEESRQSSDGTWRIHRFSVETVEDIERVEIVSEIVDNSNHQKL